VTQTIRAINVLYALTGSLMSPAGTCCSKRCRPTRSTGGVLVRCAPSRGGVDQRPLDPARYEFVTGEDFYTAALDGRIKAR
jgi:hypothetical protein